MKGGIQARTRRETKRGCVAFRKRACTATSSAVEFEPEPEPEPFRSPFSAGALAAHNEAQLALAAHGYVPRGPPAGRLGSLRMNAHVFL